MTTKRIDFLTRSVPSQTKTPVDSEGECVRRRCESGSGFKWRAGRLLRVALVLIAMSASSLALTGCQPRSSGSGDGVATALREDGEAASAGSQRPSASHPLDLWLDVDPAIGLPQSEVDDGLMMLQVFHSPELAVRGVSVVFGNTTLEKAVPIGREVASKFGPEGLGVFVGASGADQLGVETEASRALADALHERPMAILAVGPLTNIGTLLQLHPELGERILSLVMVAARRPGQSFRATPTTEPPFCDCNFDHDPAAARIILDSSVPMVFAPWEVSSHVWITAPDLADLAGRSDAGRWVSENVASWIESWRTNLGTEGFNPFDTLATAWLTHPELLRSMDALVWIQEDDDDRVEGARKPFLYAVPRGSGEAPPGARAAIYLYEPEPEFHDVLLDRLAGTASRAPSN